MGGLLRYMIGTRCEPCTLRAVLSSLQSIQISLVVYDPRQADTVLARRIIRTAGKETHTCFVPLPLSPWESCVEITEVDGSGQPIQGDGGGLRVAGIERMGLARFMRAIDWRNSEVFQAIQLGNRFCYNLGVLPALPSGEAYCSPDRSLLIRLLPTLDNPLTGQESVTPMRISDTTSIMEASQRKCIPFTVPGRAVMFFHEFSHKFENRHPDWELEADLNGLTIYLALGYSRYEALQVYQQVFNTVDTEENRNRMAHISDFINNFEYYIKKTKN